MRFLVLLLSVAGVAACARDASLPASTLGPPAQRNERTVPYPPPAAVPEVVPPAPDDRRAVWVDGSWRWTGKRYVWTRGGWVIPPDGARLVPWTLKYETDGTLRFAPAEWVDARGEPVGRPRVVEPATYPPTRRQVGEPVN